MEAEEQAREQGWVPKEEWKGDPEKWTSAEKFVEKGEKLAPILKNRIDKQQKEIDALKLANKEFGEYTQAQQNKLKQENAKLLEDLEAQRAKAIDDGDGQEFNRLDKEISQVKTSEAPQSNPMADAWLVNNEWYNKDIDLQIYADGVAERIIAEGYTGPAYWNELTRRTKEAHPEKFKNPNQSKANNVETGGDTAPKDSKAKTYDNLPEGAKAAHDKFIKAGITTSEDYLKNYEWE